MKNQRKVNLPGWFLAEAHARRASWVTWKISNEFGREPTAEELAALGKDAWEASLLVLQDMIRKQGSAYECSIAGELFVSVNLPILAPSSKAPSEKKQARDGNKSAGSIRSKMRNRLASPLE